MRRRVSRVAFGRQVRWLRVGKRHDWTVVSWIASGGIARWGMRGRRGKVEEACLGGHTGFEAAICSLRWLLAG